jgi:hypothetical protein
LKYIVYIRLVAQPCHMDSAEFNLLQQQLVIAHIVGWYQHGLLKELLNNLKCMKNTSDYVQCYEKCCHTLTLYDSAMKKCFQHKNDMNMLTHQHDKIPMYKSLKRKHSFQIKKMREILDKDYESSNRQPLDISKPVLTHCIWRLIWRH